MSKILTVRNGVPWTLGDLFHISFRGNLEGLWTPRCAEAPEDPKEDTPEKLSWPYPEPAMKAISVSPSLEGCFVGVYPNVAQYFEEKKFPHMVFHVYRPELTGRERLLRPEVLTSDRLVWDAHVTHEWRILDPVVMKMVGTIQVANTNRSATRMTHPFNDLKLPLESVGPKDIQIKRLT